MAIKARLPFLLLSSLFLASLSVSSAWSSDSLMIVNAGRLLFTLMYPDHTESYKLQPKDVLILPAGALAYVANLDDEETFEVMHLVIPLNIPGQFSDVFPGAQKSPRAFYHGFSNQTLEAAFNSSITEIQKALLGEKEEDLKPDVLMEISKELIEELSQGAKSSNDSGLPPSAPFNLGNYLIYSNDYAKVWEALPNLVPNIEEFGVAVTLTELNKSSLLLPHINSKGWVVAYVIEGAGLLEIAAPWRKDEDSPEYGQIQAFFSNLSAGDAFVIPPGYPFAVSSSSDSTLGILGFIINSEKNKRIFAAGVRDNVVNQIGDIAKPLIFTGTAEQVTKLLENQKGSYIVSNGTSYYLFDYFKYFNIERLRSNKHIHVPNVLVNFLLQFHHQRFPAANPSTELVAINVTANHTA
ncbi:hypothetical protein L6164_012764 [Bauhinia variegata]|uniref:Uncharacterized protein n=1 Tax=Bauhinia variegata TaxID=167791 RepID=A0ACB9PCM0_BAUVA|nr:hypothetical protein L6164_012764 [Bauhinia variegata]